MATKRCLMASTKSFMATDYAPPFLHRNGHLATIFPNQLRPVQALPYVRSMLKTPDDDRIAIDTVSERNARVAVLLHGLEGSSASGYTQGAGLQALNAGFDVCAMNFRSCGGIENQTLKAYHSGMTEDLDTLLNHLKNHYESAVVIGFSLGANLALKWAGEHPHDPFVTAVAAISAPIHLASSSHRLSRFENIIYHTRFLRQLKRKALRKLERFAPPAIAASDLMGVRTLREFDDLFTAPVHGFASAEDYYHQSSACHYLQEIKTPTLIINALNDSFLSPLCYPSQDAMKNNSLHLLTPRYGGHVGFAADNRMRKPFWHEIKIKEFIQTFAS
jgi:predicted alpha/beta-fold hydrolase